MALLTSQSFMAFHNRVVGQRNRSLRRPLRQVDRYYIFILCGVAYLLLFTIVFNCLEYSLSGPCSFMLRFYFREVSKRLIEVEFRNDRSRPIRSRCSWLCYVLHRCPRLRTLTQLSVMGSSRTS